LLRHGRRPKNNIAAWTGAYLNWIKSDVHFDQPAQEATLADYVHEVEHAQERIERLEKAIDEAIALMPERMKAVVEGLQSLRGIAKISAVTIMAEVGEVSRFKTARQLMGYSGVVSREYSSGERTRRGGITKTGNAHLRRIIVESAWSYRRVSTELSPENIFMPRPAKQICLRMI
jgi:transposase